MKGTILIRSLAGCALAILLAVAVSADAPLLRSVGADVPPSVSHADTVLGAGAASRRKHRQPFRKATAPIGIEVEVGAEVTAGQPVTLHVRISPAVPVSSARVAFAGDEGLALLGPAAEFQIGALGGGESFAIAVDVMPLVAGRVDLRIYLTAESARGPLVRSLVIPISVGSAAVASVSVPDRGDNVQQIRALPARETVH